MLYPIKRGLDIPISGQPAQDIKPGPEIRSVALLGDDYIGMKPTLLVQPGDKVQLGQQIFADKKTPGVVYTSPGAGTVRDVVRGEKRKFLSMIIDLDGEGEVTFDTHDNVGDLSREAVTKQLVDSGLWPSLRTRPFSRVPEPGTEPHSIFVTAMDTNPLAPDAELIIDGHKDHFVTGLSVISKLTLGKTFVCTGEDSRVPGENVPNTSFAQFSGPHPAGLVGTHIHLLDPVSRLKTVWSIGYQDVIAIGHLFSTGKIMTERVISVAGPQVSSPGLIRTRVGACLDDIVTTDTANLENARVISGSILDGRISASPLNYLGRYSNQVAVLEEGTHREFLGWQKPGFDKHTVTRVYGGSWIKDKLFALTTSQGGSKRAMVPIGTYEKVMPLDLLPTQLLRSMIFGVKTGETEEAERLGVLELAEEDVALCTYVCPGKYDYAGILRDNLETIEKEG